jgi:hypothetical protein
VFFLVFFSLISCIETPLDDYDYCQDIPELKIVNDIEIPISVLLAILDSGYIFTDDDMYYDYTLWTVYKLEFSIIEPGDSVNVFLDGFEDYRTFKIRFTALIDTIGPVHYTPGTRTNFITDDCETKEFRMSDPEIDKHFIR